MQGTARTADDLSAMQRDKPQALRTALFHLLEQLAAQNYAFVTSTPASHARVVARPDRQHSRTIRDVFGWSIPFDAALLAPEMFTTLHDVGIVVRQGDGRFVSQVRVSSVHGTLFLHSSYPTTAHDAVFLGPDSYRFADFIEAQVKDLPPGARILDYAAGAGVGGITSALRYREARLTIADINPKALFLSSINAERAGLAAETVEAKTPTDGAGDFDLIVTHPPFMIDPESRAYRDGGGFAWRTPIA